MNNSTQPINRMPIHTINENKGRLTDGLYLQIWENFEKEREKKNPYYRTTRKPRKLSTTKRKTQLLFNIERGAGEAVLMCKPSDILAAERLKIQKMLNSRSADGL